MKLFVISLLVGVCTANIVRRSYSCGSAAHYLTTDDGEIESHSGFSAGHHYGKLMDCMWTIEAPMGMYVELTAENFDLETSGCVYDYLELFDGNSMTRPTKSMGRFCGHHFSPISSTNNFLTLHFVTDGSSQYNGFKLYYNFTSVIVHECSDASQFHCSNRKCLPSRFICDGDDDCGDDSDEQGCATRPSTTPWFFMTTTSHHHSGCAADQFRCRSGSCIALAWQCDNDYDCNDRSDEMYCSTPFFHVSTTGMPMPSASCGPLSLTGTSGTIKSPNYPSNYENNAHCLWTIQAPSSTQTLAFKFDNVFSMETSSNCVYDSVKILTSGHTLAHGPFCGSISPSQMTISADHAQVEFRTDGSDTFGGFRIDWKAFQ